MRIVKYSHKVLIVLGVVLLVSSAGIVAVGAGMDKPLTFGIVSLAETAAIWGITRFFRGESEALRPPRPWWRMTELPFLSGTWALYFAIATAVSIASAVTGGASSAFPAVGQLALAAIMTVSCVRLSLALRRPKRGGGSSRPPSSAGLPRLPTSI
jgi:hypothetical protein